MQRQIDGRLRRRMAGRMRIDRGQDLLEQKGIVPPREIQRRKESFDGVDRFAIAPEGAASPSPTIPSCSISTNRTGSTDEVPRAMVNG
jgi:hypothetical protein